MARGDEITTKFRVDISDLKSGISEANQQIKLANAEFKAATAGMDDWAKSADGIRAKLDQLESVLSAQKAKLEAYNTELRRQQDAYDENAKRAAELRAKLEELASNGVSKASEEYKKYENALAACESEQEKNKKAVDRLNITVLDQQAAVNKTEAEIGKYTTAVDTLGDESKETDKQEQDLSASVEESGKSAEKSSEGFTIMRGVLADLVATGIKAAISALKDLASAAGEAWSEFDSGRDTVIKLTGATGEMASELTASYSNVSKRIVADSDTIGQAIGEVNTRFGLTGGELEALSERYLQFAEITDADVIGSIDDTQKALSAYGLGVESAADFLDILAATSQATGVNTSTLTSGIISNATAFQEMGLSIDQAVSFMGMLEKSGTNSETVLNGMRKALKNSAKDGKTISGALQELQETIEGNVAGVDGLNAAYELFGKSGDQIFGAIANGTLSFRGLAAASEDMSGTVVRTFDATRDVTDTIQLAFQGLKISGIEMFDAFVQESPVAQRGVEILNDFSQGLSDASGDWTEISSLVGRTIKSLVDLILEQAPDLLTAAGEIVKGIASSIVENLPELVPVALDILSTLATELISGLPEFISIGVEIFGSLLDGLSEALPQILTAVTAAVPEIVQALCDGIPILLEGAITFLMAIVEAIPSIVESLKTALPQVVESVVTLLVEGIPILLDGAIELFKAIVSAIPEIIPMLSETFQIVIETIFGSMDEWLPSLISAAVELLMAIVDAIPLIIDPLMAALPDIISTITESLVGSIPVILDASIQLLMGIIQALPEILLALTQEIPTIVSTIVEILIENLPLLIEGAITLFMGIVEAIPVIVVELAKSLPQIVEAILTGLIGPVEGLFDGLWKGIKSIFKNVGSWFKAKFSSAWEGIQSIWASAGDWFGDIWESIKETFAAVGEWFSEKFSSAWEGIKTAWGSVSQWFSDLWDGIKEVFSGAGAWFSETFDKVAEVIKVPLNVVIRAMNQVIDGLNTISIDIPDWVPIVGGETFGINLAKIPELARGGVLGRGQTGFLEGSGAEAVVPLENNKYWIREVVEELIGQMREAEAAGEITNIGGRRDYNFTQIINAPSSPSRIELYRQTRNLLSFAQTAAAGGV